MTNNKSTNNLLAVFRAALTGKRLSKSDISEMCKLSRATVSKSVDFLIENKILRKSPSRSNKRVIEVFCSNKHYVEIFVKTNTYTYYFIIDLCGRIVKTVSAPHYIELERFLKRVDIAKSAFEKGTFIGTGIISDGADTASIEKFAVHFTNYDINKVHIESISKNSSNGILYINLKNKAAGASYIGETVYSIIDISEYEHNGSVLSELCCGKNAVELCMALASYIKTAKLVVPIHKVVLTGVLLDDMSAFCSVCQSKINTKSNDNIEVIWEDAPTKSAIAASIKIRDDWFCSKFLNKH